jgi:uncharacterized OB-fold protein
MDAERGPVGCNAIRELTMRTPYFWRTQKQRYLLTGTVCLHCGARRFPPRDVCPECGAPARALRAQREQDQHYAVPVLYRAPSLSEYVCRF